VATPDDHDRRVKRAAKQLASVLGLAAVDSGGFEQRLRDILRVDSETLDVARVSYWALAGDGMLIRCEAMYRADARTYESGLELRAADYPRYFDALRTGAPIAADDAHEDPRTREFSAGYLRPAGIGAMLDVPVYVRGTLVGVVCHEHIGSARAWTLDEQSFAVSIAQLMSLAIEARRREAAELAVSASEARFRAIVDVAPMPMLVLSEPDGACLYGNKAASELSGIPLEEMLGRAAPEFYADARDRDDVLRELAAKGRIRDREVKLRRADMSEYWATVSIEPLEYGGRRAAVVAVMDVTERHRREEELRFRALHDALTGLPNRALITELVERELSRARRETPGYRFAVLFVDLDDFKNVNDAHGHDVGDEVLKSVAGRLRGAVRATDVAGRLGGDEFVVLLPAIRGASDAAEVAGRIVDALRHAHGIGDEDVTCTASVGLAVGDDSARDAHAIIHAADAAMYEAKQRGKSGWFVTGA